MATKIIYPNPDGSISLVMPTGELPIEDVANKDIPAGTPYLFVEDEDLPEDHSFFNAWEADFGNPDGVAIGSEAWYAAKEQA
jgi:hypothetical protein